MRTADCLEGCRYVLEALQPCGKKMGNGTGRIFLAITALTVSIAASIKEAVEGIAERGIDALCTQDHIKSFVALNQRLASLNQ